MKLQVTKTPLLIVAIAAAVTVASLSSASANVVWTGATTADVEAAQVVDANFKGKLKKHKLHHGHKYHGVKKKKFIAHKKYASPRKKFFVKKSFKKFY